MLLQQLPKIKVQEKIDLRPSIESSLNDDCSKDEIIEIYQHICADLKKILGTSLITPTTLSFRDRVDAADFFIEKIVFLKNLHNPYCWSPIEEINAKKRFILYHNQDHRLITINNAWHRDIDDFTRHIPQRVKNKINVLKSTRFNYLPKILDGGPVEYETLLTRDLLVANANARAYKRRLTFEFDPALTIELLGDRYVIDYWTEEER